MGRRNKQLGTAELFVKLCMFSIACITFAVVLSKSLPEKSRTAILPLILAGAIAGGIAITLLLKSVVRKGPPSNYHPPSQFNSPKTDFTTAQPDPVKPVAEPTSQRTSRVEPSLQERLRKIDWFQFEKLVAAIYSANGFEVTRRGGSNPDGGVDIVAIRNGSITVIQCKHWQNQLVKPDKVRELIGAKAIERANAAILVTLSGCTEAATKLAQEQGVELVDEDALIRSLKDLGDLESWPDISEALDPLKKNCPKCESPLVERVAKRGNNAGSSFWGCSTYPSCKYTLPMR